LAWASVVWSFQMSEPKRGGDPAEARPEGFRRKSRISRVLRLLSLGSHHTICGFCGRNALRAELFRGSLVYPVTHCVTYRVRLSRQCKARPAVNGKPFTRGATRATATLARLHSLREKRHAAPPALQCRLRRAPEGRAGERSSAAQARTQGRLAGGKKPWSEADARVLSLGKDAAIPCETGLAAKRSPTRYKLQNE
jgi:hypothetical protein